jgi:uncharacterized integral membrane protein (TIGR00697 family)
MNQHLTKPQKLLILLSGLFVSSIIVAELIGVKLFSLENSLGIEKFSFSILGQDNLSFVLSVGVLPWPIIFILTDVINDYYGFKTVKFISISAVFFILMAFLILSLAIHVSPDDVWWQTSKSGQGINDMNLAFSAIFDQGRNIIIASIIAFLIGQLSDALIFRQIKKITKDKYIGLRATISTLVSQLLDSLLVTLIAFYLLSDMPFKLALALAIAAYIYKFIIAILSTPILYLVHFFIELYLGKNLAREMRERDL